MFDRFGLSTADSYPNLKARGYSDQEVERLPIPELIDNMTRWVAANPS